MESEFARNKQASKQIAVQVFAAWKTFLELTFLSIEEQMSLYHLLFENNSRWFLAIETCVERTVMLLVCSRGLSLERWLRLFRKTLSVLLEYHIYSENGRGRESWESYGPLDV